MPVHRVEISITDIRNGVIRLWLDSVTSVEITVTEVRQLLTGPGRNDPVQIAARATELLQDKLDVRIPLTDLPNGLATGHVADNIDPDRFTDPAVPNLFWQVIDGVTHLVGRPLFATVIWTGDTYIIRLRTVEGE